MNGVRPFPAPSLRELLSECEAEGVSFNGSSVPTIYTPAHINSKIFDRLQASEYTPQNRSRANIPHNVNHPSAGCFVSGRVIFGFYVEGDILPFNRVLAKPWGCGRLSSPLRKL